MTSLRETVSEIKALTDLIDLAEDLGIEQIRKCWLCPFHDDHHPSLQIKPRWFRCYVCGAKGDAIKLLMQHKGLAFREALEFLARRTGIVLPGRHSCPKLRQRQPRATSLVEKPRDQNVNPSVPTERCTEILTAFAKAARIKESREDDHPVFAYLRNRGISRETAHRAGIGYVGPNYESASRILLEELAPLPELQAAGLFNAKGNFRLFKHRLVIPYEFDGTVHILQARNIDWQSKERDGPKELTIGPITIPFNANVFLQQPEQVYVCEGAMDTLALLEVGFPAVGIPGVQNFKAWWVELFADVNDVVLAFDNDPAGWQATQKVTGHFAKAGRHVRLLQLPEGIKDVNELLLAEQRRGKQ